MKSRILRRKRRKHILVNSIINRKRRRAIKELVSSIKNNNKELERQRLLEKEVLEQIRYHQEIETQKKKTMNLKIVTKKKNTIRERGPKHK